MEVLLRFAEGLGHPAAVSTPTHSLACQREIEPAPHTEYAKGEQTVCTGHQGRNRPNPYSTSNARYPQAFEGFPGEFERRASDGSIYP